MNEQYARIVDYLDAGQYVLTANYFAGNTGQYISNEWVVQLAEQQAPPPPVCYFDPDNGGYLCY